ncbi:MAG: polysaccharide pyruvyl transferase family protein [Xenococcaceae cyanobacterium MO_188.B29]|nr:polysaccharide pyruvyl transferase family protein [Xenococcaceae cyanobacterium MO_188.B29]
MKNYPNNLIFCSAITQYENLGDLVINRTLLRNLRNYGRLIVDTRGVPDWFCEQLELSVDERYSNYRVRLRLLVLLFGLKALFNLNSQVYLIRTPGGHSGSIENWIDGIKSLAWFCIFRIIGVRICWFGASIESFSIKREMFEKWYSNFMHFYSLRDSISEDYARKIGIERLASFPDLAWLMETPPASNEPMKIDGDYVIFSFRECPHKLAETVEYNNNLYAVLDAIVKLVCEEWSKKLVISYQVTRDYKFCKGIRDRYKYDCDVMFIESQVDSQCMYDLYSRASMVFSNRLHVLLFSMVCGSLPVAVIDLAAHNKITGIFLDARLMRLVIDIRKSSDEVELLRSLATDAPVIEEEIALYRKRQLSLGEALFRRVMTGA